MSWLAGDPSQLGIVAAKAGLMYGTALFGLRVGERRTLAQWSAIDFAAAVAIGAIVGRTAVASDQTYLTGAVALLALIVAHRLASVARFAGWFSSAVDHRVRLLVVNGKIQQRQLRWAGLTESDLSAQLRQRGVLNVDDLRYVLYESKGGLTVVARDEAVGELAMAGIRSAAGPHPVDAGVLQS